MKIRFIHSISTSILLMSLSPAEASFRGNPETDVINQQAIICMNIGITAALTGLDDIELTTTDINGRQGAIFRGQDDFQLVSNGAVSVKITEGQLQQQQYAIATRYNIDGKKSQFDTVAGEAHDGTHTLNIEAQLGNISSQLAGSYETEVVLTVVPLYGDNGGCGQRTVTYPSQSGWATLAFEDLYPNPGDADYNDMVVYFRVEEHYNASQQLETINMDFIPIARGAGYNHALKLDFDGVIDKSKNITYESEPAFEGNAEISVTYTNLTNDQQSTKYYNKDDDIDLIHNTRSSIGGFANVYDNGDVSAPNMMTSVEINLENPELNPFVEEGSVFDFITRPYLHVMNTGQDIDLYQVNPTDGMIDPNGYPFGIAIPDIWRWPLERTNIDNAYPYFAEYRAWLSGETTELSDQAKYWYNFTSSEYRSQTYDVENLDFISEYLQSIE